MNANLALSVMLNALYFSGIQAVARRKLQGCGAILMLHHVRDMPAKRFSPNAHLSISPAFLEQALLALKNKGVEFVSMDTLAERLAVASPDASRPCIAVTLDDGYRDNLENAVPLFRKYHVPYTIYVAPGLTEGQAALWWEDLEAVIAARDHFVMHAPRKPVEFDASSPAKKRRIFGELVKFLTNDASEFEQRRIVGELAWQAGVDASAHLLQSMMNWQEISALANDPLCTIGAHGIDHFALARLEAGQARSQMLESARIIEMETGTRPRHFAYPYGYRAAAGQREFGLARECGFATAVTTRHGVLHAAHNEYLHALPRISLNGNFQKTRHVRTMLSGVTTVMANRGKLLNIA